MRGKDVTGQRFGKKRNRKKSSKGNLMVIHRGISQCSDQWHALRAGRITASEVGAFCVAERSLSLTIPEIKAELDKLAIDYKKSASKGELTALLPNPERWMRHTQGTIDARSKLYAKKIAERSGAEMIDPFESFAMRRGKELEPEARELYQFVTGAQVEEVAFVEHNNELCGASPDGIISDGFDKDAIVGGLEIKCHAPETHALYLLDPDAFEDEHKHQLHWQMAIMGAKWIDLFGYCPRLPYIKRRVWRSDYTERFVDAIEELSDEYRAAIAQYNAIFAQQRGELAKLNEERSLSA